jgi:hypothetical protein
MAQRHFVFIDATRESLARSFAENPIFQTWLHSYDNIQEALEFINGINLPYSIDIYVARDNILDEVLPSGTNGPIRTLLRTFCDLRTILHVTIFCPNLNTDLVQQARSIITDPRMLKDAISIMNLHSNICKEGIQYWGEEITRCIRTNEIHLISNLQRNIDELMEYSNRITNDRRKMIDTMEEAHSNKLGEEPS